MSTSPTLDPKIWEAWFTLMAQTMRQTRQTQEAFEAFGTQVSGPEDLHRWMGQFLPDLSASTSAELYEQWLEQWQRVLGVVPYVQYQAVVNENEELRQKLLQADATIQSLRNMLVSKDMQEETAQQMLDTWNSVLSETFKTQSEWMQKWATVAMPDSGESDDQQAEQSAADET